MARDFNAEEEEAPTPQVEASSKLKTMGRYAMLAIAPVVSVAALAVAVIALNHDRTDRAQLSAYVSRIDSLSTTVAETKEELENYKVTLARDKSMRNDERKKIEELDTKIIQSVAHIQTKLKISPTLEEQMRVVVKAPVVLPPAEAAVPTPVPSNPSNKHPATTTAPAQKETGKKKINEKVLKDVVDKFNKK